MKAQVLYLWGMLDGFLLIDKPSGPTSHDVVDSVRRLFGKQLYAKRYTLNAAPKVGHAGTLDPFATGLLIVGIGKATKEMSKLVGLDKEYEATLQLGATSDTYDRTGQIHKQDSSFRPVRVRATPPLSSFRPERAGASGVEKSHSRARATQSLRTTMRSLDSTTVPLEMTTIKETLEKFTGTIQQIPPMYSAKKVGGKKLYELARKGITIERKPSRVTIYSIDHLNLSAIRYTLYAHIRCSSGTYIRSLAHDIGQALGCGAYVKELRRTAVGPFTINETVALRELSAENLPRNLRTIEAILARMHQ